MTTASLQSLGYLPVATATLHPAAVLDCDLYIRRPGCSFAELYRGRDYPLEREDIQILRATGVDHLYIRLEEADAYRTYLCQHVLRQRDIPVTARLAALREITRVAFQDALDGRNCKKAVDVASQFGRNLAQTVADDSLVFREPFATLEHDYGAFTHACNVSLYSA